MRTSLKCLVFYLIGGVILLNLFLVGQIYFHHEDTQKIKTNEDQNQNLNDFLPVIEKHDSLVNRPSTKLNNLKNSNEFLVLDWTGQQHIFREQDPIKCKFLFSNRYDLCLMEAVCDENNRKKNWRQLY